MRPVCSKCEVELKCHKTGVLVIEHANFGPYKIWDADEYECAVCGIRIVTGFGQRPISEHFMDDFDMWLSRAEGEPNTVRNYENARQAKSAH
jgi:hypothetical protein